MRHEAEAGTAINWETCKARNRSQPRHTALPAAQDTGTPTAA